MQDADRKKLDEILDKYNGAEGFLIQLLLDLQSEFNWIPRDAVSEISERLKIPRSQIFRIASFYKAMSLNPIGKHKISVCTGTACQVRGAQKILDQTESKLKVKESETTPDMNFTLKKVNCLGCCAIGPVIVVDNDYYGRVASEKVDKILRKYGQE